MNSKTRTQNTVIVWLLIAAFVLIFAGLSVRRHLSLSSNGMDLGNVNQALWSTAHGDFLAFTNMAPVQNRLALHVEPILLLLLPPYWLGLGGPVWLLIVQALVVGLGAWPIYWLARDRLVPFLVKYEPDRSQVTAPIKLSDGAHGPMLPAAGYLLLILPLSYLLSPALEAAVMYDFHAVTLAPTFLLFAFYYLERKRTAMFALFALLAMSCKEDMGLTVAMLGLFALLFRRQWKLGGVTFLVGLAWFWAAVFVIQPQFSPVGANVQADRYAWLGQTPVEMLDTLLFHPQLVWAHLEGQANLLTYLQRLLWPTAFLPLLNPPTWLPILPSLAVNLLSDSPFTWRLEDFHYAAPVVPFIFISALYGIRTLGRVTRRFWRPGTSYIVVGACVLLLAASLIYHWGRGFSPLARPFNPWPISDHHRQSQELFRRVDPDAALFAQSNLNPHVSSRSVLYQDLAIPEQLRAGQDVFADNDDLPPPDLLLFDVSTLVNHGNFQATTVAGLLQEGSFGPVLAQDGYLLLDRAAPAASLPDEFTDFARADQADIVYPLQADFGDAIRLHGFELGFDREEEVQPTLYLEALRLLDENYFISLYLLDEWGTPLGATIDDQPALLWYPTSQWQPGEMMKVTFNTLPWYTRNTPSYRLAVGIMLDRDPWQRAARLQPQLPQDQNKPCAVRLPDDGTLLELARFEHVFGMPDGGPALREYHAPRQLTALDRNLGDQVRLLGYRLTPVTCDEKSATAERSSCRVGVGLYWQAMQPLEVDYKVFVHVVGPQGAADPPQLSAQRDSQPDSGAYPCSRWETGEVVADPVQIWLPPDLTPGSYDLQIGMYHPENGQRLRVLNGGGQPIDDKIIIPDAVDIP